MNNMPTDNLYKFMTLFGLILMGYSFSFVLTETRNLNNEFFKAKQEFSKIALEVIFLEDDQAILEKDVSGLAEYASKNKKLKKDKENIENTAQTLLISSKDVRKKYRVLKSKNEEMKINSARVIAMGREVIILGILFWFIGGFGFLLFVWGFCLWYYRLQRYLDEKIVTEYREKNSGDAYRIN